MNLKAFLFNEDRGVSPVIGVILMVAITVILAAVIATFVMNMGPSEASPPNAQFEWEQDGGASDYDLVHAGGEAVDMNDVSHSGQGTPQTGEKTAGDVVVDSVTSSGTVTLTWENPNSDETQILYEGETPF